MFLGISFSDWLTIAAILIAPVVAVQVQKFIERFRERKANKTYIFRTLMATRAARVSPEHVAALNMIDIEFGERKVLFFTYSRAKDKEVLRTWKQYHDHLITPYTPDTFNVWVQNGDELFHELLFRMARSLGHDIDKVQLKRGVYTPIAHTQQELVDISNRDNWAKILRGERAVPVEITNLPLGTNGAESDKGGTELSATTEVQDTEQES